MYNVKVIIPAIHRPPNPLIQIFFLEKPSISSHIFFRSSSTNEAHGPLPSWPKKTPYVYNFPQSLSPCRLKMVELCPETCLTGKSVLTGNHVTHVRSRACVFFVFESSRTCVVWLNLRASGVKSTGYVGICISLLACARWRRRQDIYCAHASYGKYEADVQADSELWYGADTRHMNRRKKNSKRINIIISEVNITRSIRPNGPLTTVKTV